MSTGPRELPTLEELAATPTLVAELAPAVVEALLTRAHVVQSVLLGRLLALRAAPAANRGTTAGDGAVGLEEAAQVLGMRRSTLYRKWRALGIGYRDVDGRVKFTRATLHRYLARKGG